MKTICDEMHLALDQPIKDADLAIRIGKDNYMIIQIGEQDVEGIKGTRRWWSVHSYPAYWWRTDDPLKIGLWPIPNGEYEVVVV